MVLDGDWPGNSPGLKIIENFNAVLKAELATKVLHSFDGLKRAACTAWAKIPQDDIRRAFNSMPDHLAAVAKAKGGNTRY